MTASDRRDDGSDPSRKADEIWHAIEHHRKSAEDILPGGDPASIKELYVELGRRLESAAEGDPDVLPVLSYPENAPVVAGLAADLEGLVLDAGCGPNPVVSVLLGRDSRRRIVVLDIGLGTVRLARTKATDVGVPVLAVVADLEALPFRDGAFDVSVCQDTIEHVPDDRKAVAELARVVRTSGRVILATPNRIRLEVLVRRVRDKRKRVHRPDSDFFASNSHLREYTFGDLEHLVRDRFRVKRRASVGWSGGWRATLASRLVRRWPFRKLSRMVVLDLEPR